MRHIKVAVFFVTSGISLTALFQNCASGFNGLNISDSGSVHPQISFAQVMEEAQGGSVQVSTTQTSVHALYEFHVDATRGSDESGTGDANHPFASLEKTRLAVRERLATSNGAITVWIHDGVYRLAQTLRFTAEDSGRAGAFVSYRAVNQGRAIVSGAVQLDPSKWSLVDGSQNLWKAHVGLRDVRQVFVDGKRAQRSRLYTDPSSYSINSARGYDVSSGEAKAIQLPWGQTGDVEAVSVILWKQFRCPVTGTGAEFVQIDAGCWSRAQQVPGGSVAVGLPTWFENSVEFIDTPREWAYRRSTGELFAKFEAGVTPGSLNVEIPRLSELVRLEGTAGEPVRNIAFEGIAFMHASEESNASSIGHVPLQAAFALPGAGDQWTALPAAVAARYVRSLVFYGNSFVQSGATGLSLERGTQATQVRYNWFADLGGGGISVGGIEEQDRLSKGSGHEVTGNMIADNSIEFTGMVYTDSVGVFVGYANCNQVLHNSLSQLPYTGISVGWGWNYDSTASFANDIKSNKISGTNMVQGDGGGIYTLSRQDGTMIDQNVIYGVNSAWFTIFPGGELVKSNGLYLDNGSSGISVGRNVVGLVANGESVFMQKAPPAAKDITFLSAPSVASDDIINAEAGPRGGSVLRPAIGMPDSWMLAAPSSDLSRLRPVKAPVAPVRSPTPTPPPTATPIPTPASPVPPTSPVALDCSAGSIRNDGSARKAVHFAYCHILRRPPEEPAWTSWASEISAGRLNIRTLMLQLLHSSEAQVSLGPTTQHFVWWIYERALHRTPSDAEVISWTNAIQSGQRTNNSVMELVVNSTEMGNFLSQSGF